MAMPGSVPRPAGTKARGVTGLAGCFSRLLGSPYFCKPRSHLSCGPKADEFRALRVSERRLNAGMSVAAKAPDPPYELKIQCVSAIARPVGSRSPTISDVAFKNSLPIISGTAQDAAFDGPVPPDS